MPGLGSRGLGLLSVLQLNSAAKWAGRLGASGVGGPAPAISRRDLTPGNPKAGEGLRAAAKRLGGAKSEGHCSSCVPEETVRPGGGGRGDRRPRRPSPRSHPSSCGLSCFVHLEASVSSTATLVYEQNSKEEMI